MMDNEVFNVFPKLESERLWFLNFSDADPYDIFELRSSKEINKYLDRKPEQLLDDAIKHIKRVKLLEKCRENYFYNGQYLDSVIYCLIEKDLQ